MEHAQDAVLAHETEDRSLLLVSQINRFHLRQPCDSGFECTPKPQKFKLRRDACRVLPTVALSLCVRAFVDQPRIVADRAGVRRRHDSAIHNRVVRESPPLQTRGCFSPGQNLVSFFVIPINGCTDDRRRVPISMDENKKNYTEPHNAAPDAGGIQRATMNLWPEAGRALGLGRAATYNAAKAGQIPCLRIGKRLLVPRAAFNRLLSGELNAA